LDRLGSTPEELDATDRVGAKDAAANPTAPIVAGEFVVGVVDEVNGPSSKQAQVPISRYEARLLLNHWMKEYERIDYFCTAHGCSGSSEMRTSYYTQTRISALRDAGLITQGEVDAAVPEAYAEHAESWRNIERDRDAQGADEGRRKRED
jgi:hypothetical protein